MDPFGLYMGNTPQAYQTSLWERHRPAAPDGGATGAEAVGVMLPGVGSGDLLAQIFMPSLAIGEILAGVLGFAPRRNKKSGSL